MNIFKNVFLFFAVSAAVFMAAAQSSTLVKIVNDSSASISATLGKDSIKIGARKSARCLATFPFHTIDLFNFVLDRAQIPSDAYVIETMQGKFFLWCDERGVIIARDRGQEVALRDGAVPVVAWPSSRDGFMRFIAIVDALGSVKISPLN